MKRTLKRGALLGLFVLVTVVGCGTPTPPPKPTPTAAPAGKGASAGGNIVAEGRVMPVKSALLSFGTGGIVAAVPVAVDDHVEAGKVLVQLDTRALELQRAQAEATLAGAQAKLDQLKRGPTPEETAAAQQNLASAQAAYDNLMHPGPNDIAALKANSDKAKAQLDRAQAAYDQVGGDSNPNAGMLPQRAALQSAWLDYQAAQAAYNARLNPTNAQVQQALAAVQNAKDQLAKLQPTADNLAAAQADVNAAQAARDLAAQQVKNAQLVAPFAGTVMSLDIRVGEYAAPGAVVVRLADASAWQVETTDLTELNVAQVSEGSTATLTFDAIPGLELPGKVVQVKPYGESKQGDIVYTVVVAPAQQDARLRWNMTAKVSIEPQANK